MPLLNPLLAVFAALVLTTSPARATNVGIGVTISGEIQPGVYGRIDIGNRPPPVVVYPQPVVIVPGQGVARPLYLHVPPGHAKNWRKHCRKYDACGVPVYFVRSAEYDGYDTRRGRGDDDQGRGHGNGHGKGRDKD